MKQRKKQTKKKHILVFRFDTKKTQHIFFFKEIINSKLVLINHNGNNNNKNRNDVIHF